MDYGHSKPKCKIPFVDGPKSSGSQLVCLIINFCSYHIMPEINHPHKVGPSKEKILLSLITICRDIQKRIDPISSQTDHRSMGQNSSLSLEISGQNWMPVGTFVPQ